MKRAFFATIGLLVALQAPVAGQLYQGTPPGQAEFDFVGASPGVPGTFGTYVGPYTGDFIGDAFGQFSIYCVDYLHYAGDMGMANISALSGSLSKTRLGGPWSSLYGSGDALAKYRKAAYLSSLFDSYGTSEWSAIHAAIWEITSGATGTDAGRTTYVEMANANYGSVNLDEWYVISHEDVGDGYLESGDGKGQEFLMRRSVPEPATVLLLFTGLVMLVGVNRKRIFVMADLH